MSINWHDRFVQQARWTRDLRAYLFECAGVKKAHRILEVGCGTGAVLADLDTKANLHGLNLDPSRLREAKLHMPQSMLTCGDALRLPYPPRSFDITFCHYLLLWLKDPLQGLLEMKRVTCAGGAVLALAEPDYTQRVDKPEVLAPLGQWQEEALREQGADPSLGERLADLFRNADMEIIETGRLQRFPDPSGKDIRGEQPSRAERAMEWTVLESDLAGRVPGNELHRLKGLDEKAWERGERVLHVPTYFAWGRA